MLFWQRLKGLRTFRQLFFRWCGSLCKLIIGGGGGGNNYTNKTDKSGTDTVLQTRLPKCGWSRVLVRDGVHYLHQQGNRLLPGRG